MKKFRLDATIILTIAAIASMEGLGQQLIEWRVLARESNIVIE